MFFFLFRNAYKQWRNFFVSIFCGPYMLQATSFVPERNSQFAKCYRVGIIQGCNYSVNTDTVQLSD